MFNTKNICEFEGRLTADVVMSAIGTGANAFAKAVFTIAVDRTLTTAQKATKKAEANVPFAQKQLQTADFVQLQATGKTAEAIGQFFAKGKPIKVFCTYKTWTTTDAQGVKKYGSGFDVEHFGFTTSDTTLAPAGAPATGGYVAPVKTGYVAPTKAAAPDVEPIDEDDVPF